MTRPVSWLPRLPVIARSVAESVRSHYASPDLERLFQIQPRSAQMLMRLLPTVRIGKSQLVEREALAGLLGRLVASDDSARELAAWRVRGKPPVIRRKLRDLVPHDVAAGRTGLPANVALAPGSLTVRFETVEELAGALYHVAALLQEDLDGFAGRYEPAGEAAPQLTDEDRREREDAQFIREWIAKQG